MQIRNAASWGVFQSSNFRLFCGARLLASLAMQMQNVAVGWLVYDLTHSAWALGLVGLVAFTPAVALALFAGHVADAYDRRLILTSSHATTALAAATLFALVWFEVKDVWPIYLCVILVGSARAFGHPASQAMMPNLVPREQFSNAVAWNSSIWQTGSISGPAVGGLLYALGPTTVFAAAAICFGVAAALIAGIQQRVAPAPRARLSWETLMAGLGFIRSQPVILGAITLDLVAVLLGGATALLPIFAQDILHVGPLGLGLLRSMPAAGALVMGFLLAYRPLDRRSGPRMLQAIAVFGLATIGFGLSTNILLSLACLFVVGAADMVSVFVRQTLVQGETPDAMRGRVSAVNTVFIGASNELGEFESGTLAALTGAVPAVVIGGVATLAVAALWGRLFPALASRDRLVAARPASKLS